MAPGENEFDTPALGQCPDLRNIYAFASAVRDLAGQVQEALLSRRASGSGATMATAPLSVSSP